MGDGQLEGDVTVGGTLFLANYAVSAHCVAEGESAAAMWAAVIESFAGQIRLATGDDRRHLLFSVHDGCSPSGLAALDFVEAVEERSDVYERLCAPLAGGLVSLRL